MQQGLVTDVTMVFCREIRNVDLRKGGRPRDAASPKAKASAAANPQASSLVSQQQGRHGMVPLI